jgi:hypothetical protein
MNVFGAVMIDALARMEGGEDLTALGTQVATAACRNSGFKIDTDQSPPLIDKRLYTFTFSQVGCRLIPFTSSMCSTYNRVF